MKTNFPANEAYQFFYPSVTILVTCKNNIMAAAWECPLSKEPPMCGIAVAPKRYTHALIGKEKEFGINFLTKDYLREILLCGTKSGREVKKFEESGLTKLKAEKLKNTFLIKEAIATLECKLANSVEAGDHTFFIGEVLSARAEEDYLENILDYKKPYHCTLGKFATITEEINK